MKKIKTLLTIPALVAVLPATFAMTQCSPSSKSGDRTPTIDPSVSEKVDISITKNDDGSISCSLSAKSTTQKISSVTVKIGSNTLTAGTDYEITSTSSNASINGIKIFKSALDKYSGDIVIVPTVVDKEFNGIVVELTKSNFQVGDNFTKDQVQIYKSYEGTKSEETISWTDSNLKISYDGVDITATFKTSGFECEDIGTETFVITYNNKYSQTININVSARTYTITCLTENECVTLSKRSIEAEEGSTWGNNKPTVTASRKDVDLDNFEYTWLYDDGTEIGENDPIEESFNANLVLTFKNTTTKDAIECDTAGEKSKYGVDCYIPAQCATSPAEWFDSNNQWKYTFTIDLGSLNGNFQYFWIAIKDSSYTKGGRLLTLGNDNIVSVTYNGSAIEKSKLSFHTMNGGTYMKYTSSPFTSGVLEIEYRSLVENASENIIPAYEVD